MPRWPPTAFTSASTPQRSRASTPRNRPNSLAPTCTSCCTTCSCTSTPARTWTLRAGTPHATSSRNAPSPNSTCPPPAPLAPSASARPSRASTRRCRWQPQKPCTGTCRMRGSTMPSWPICAHRSTWTTTIRGTASQPQRRPAKRIRKRANAMRGRTRRTEPRRPNPPRAEPTWRCRPMPTRRSRTTSRTRRSARTTSCRKRLPNR